MVEPFVVKLLDNGQLSLSYQKVSLANILEFYPLISNHERKLIQHLERIDNRAQAKIINVSPNILEASILKISQAKDTKNKGLYEHLRAKISEFKSLFFNGLDGSELVFETSKDGYPAGTKLLFRPDVQVKMEYRFVEDTLQIRPQYSDPALKGLPATVLDENIAAILVGQNLIKLPSHLRPNRFKPFAQKSVMEVQKRFFKEFAEKFLLFDLKENLADIQGDVDLMEVPFSKADVYFSFTFEGSQLGLFEKNEKAELKLPPKLNIDLQFLYGDWVPKNESETIHTRFQDKARPSILIFRRDFEKEKLLKAHLESEWLLLFSSPPIQISFQQLRDAIIPKLDLKNEDFQFRFSPEFRQINLKSSRLSIKVLEKIDYFQIEGSIDWDGHSFDIHELRQNYEVENGWLKKDGLYWALNEDDQQFLNQIFLLSSQNKELSISRKTLKAIKLEQADQFARHWEKMTTLLVNSEKQQEQDLGLFCPNFELREYQKKGVEWFISLYNNQLGGILADDMGLGKTFQTAAFLLFQIKNRKEKKPILILMPSTLVFNWEHELRRFSPEFKVLVHSGTGRMRSLAGMADYFNVILVSYQTLARDLSIFEKEEFLTLVVDEAHHLKNPGTVSYKAVQKINAENIFLLTGTPMQNSPVDLWALSELCNPGLLSQKIKPQTVQRVDNQARFMESLGLMQNLVKPFVLRRTKENVLNELPAKTISVVYCNMEEEQELEYLAQNQLIASEINDMSFTNQNVRSVKILKALTKLRLLANHPALIGYDENTPSGKFALVAEKLKEVLNEGHKILVFSSFVKHLDLFSSFLEKEGIAFSFLSGKTRDRKQQVEKFQQTADCNVFLISLKAGGFGLNLVEANYVFLLDPWWNPAAENNAMDRVYRIGQKNAVTVYKFITSNTVEEKILELQERKQILANQLFDTAEMAQPQLTLQALQEILTARIG